MAVIKHNELFDFPAYEAAIKEVKESTKDFGKTAEDVIKRLKVQQKDLNDTLGLYASQLRNFNVTTADAATGLKTYARSIDDVNGKMNDYKTLQNGVETVTKSNKAAVLELTRQYKQLLAAQEDLNPASANYKEQARKINDQIKQLIPGIKAYNAAVNSSKQSVQAAEGSYKAMQQQLTALRNQLKSMPGAFEPFSGNLNKSNREAVNLSREIQRLDANLKKADSQMGVYSRNVGNYASAFKGLGGAIGALAGITSTFEVARFVFETNREFESLNVAILNVSGSTQEFAKNQQFLAKIAEDYGLEIIGLTQSFKNFFAAGTQAGLSAEATRRIFDQVSKVAANLALTQDQVNGVFTAFGQIASKGKVQAEELRGQIGERIPGAFAIAARAIGVTQAELNKMLKDGEVISQDFLPKFAAELEKTFGKADRVETLTAATNRLFNVFKTGVQNQTLVQFLVDVLDLITKISKVGISGFNEVIRLLNISRGPAGAINQELLDSAERLTKERNERIAREQKEFLSMTIADQRLAIDQARQESEIAAEKLNNIIKVYGNKRRNIKVLQADIEFKDAQGRLQRMVDLWNEKYGQMNAAAGVPKGDGKPSGPSAAEIAESRARQQQDLLKRAAELDIAQYELLVSQKLITEEQFQKEKLRIMQMYLDKAIAIEKGLGAGADGGRVAGFQKERIAAEVSFNNFKNKLNEERQEKERKGLQEGIRRNKAQLDQIGKDKKDGLEKQFNDELNAENRAFQLLQARNDTTYQEEIEHLERIRAIKIKYGQDTAEDEIAIERRKEEEKRRLRLQSVDLAGEAGQALLQIFNDQAVAESEQRLSQLEKEKELELAAVGNNAAAREAIEKRFAQKEKEERIRRARIEKNQALFQIALETAIGAARAVAASPLTFGMPFLPFVIAQGAIQAAVVAARPIPAFKKGTKNAPQGLAIVGEEGPELIEKNGRMWITPGKASFVRLTGGEKIHTAKETERIIERAEKQTIVSNMSDTSAVKAALSISQARQVETREVIRDSMRINTGQLQQAFQQAVKDIPIHQTLWDERGIRERQIQQNSRTTKLNSRLT